MTSEGSTSLQLQMPDRRKHDGKAIDFRQFGLLHIFWRFFGFPPLTTPGYIFMPGIEPHRRKIMGTLLIPEYLGNSTTYNDNFFGAIDDYFVCLRIQHHQEHKARKLSQEDINLS